jgi:hypothetical protein
MLQQFRCDLVPVLHNLSAGVWLVHRPRPNKLMKGFQNVTRSFRLYPIFIGVVPENLEQRTVRSKKRELGRS